ncbi:MAG TPA: DUF427 domain-containing protein [Polyangia bacterium]|nr:DUF427 domain-containing protein [Polyangia bacterium]
MARTVLQPGPQHPITVEPAPGRVTVQVAGTPVADTSSALALQEANYPVVYYVPLADVRSEVLKPSDHTTYCPYKGDASYYSLATPNGEVADAVWYYAEPYSAVAEIAGHVAFYANKVDIIAT